MSLPDHILHPKPKRAEVLLEYQNTILELPTSPEKLHAQACSNDTITVNTWRDTWIKNMAENKKRFGSFKDHSAGKLYKKHEFQPCILAGAGPSLKLNVHELKDRGNIPLISCLHNFHLMEDNGARPDYYVTLDAGPIVIEEVYDGGTKTPDEYWALSKGRKLIAYVGTDPKLFDKWQGEVYFFAAPIPDVELMQEMEKIEKFRCFMSNGGNVLGACLYFARGFLGCSTTAFVGADFCFSYDKKFHAWNSKYDEKLGYVVKLTDVHGNKRLTWQSYANFKGWFDQLPYTTPQMFVNCTEGGCLGSYPEGNIHAIHQMPLAKFIFTHRLHEEIADQMTSPETAENRLLF